MNANNWCSIIFNSSVSFKERCRKVFRFQIENNRIYQKFSETLGYKNPENILPEELPLLPIRAFKKKKITAGHISHQTVFKSSGTGSMEQSRHYVHNTEIYQEAISREFYRHFPKDLYSVLCYLPGYSDNPYSSLIWMMKYLISKDETGLSGFWDGYDFNPSKWEYNVKKSGKKPLLFGAAFGLLDLTEQSGVFFDQPVEIIETGGMKTYRREMTKEKLREKIGSFFHISPQSIHSEYGMCELLSQMYAIGSEWYTAPEWVRVSIRDADNPQRICAAGKEGKIGIIDLANVYSCPFILTEDRGVADDTGRFKVLGRWNPDNPRGCNFLIDHD